LSQARAEADQLDVITDVVELQEADAAVAVASPDAIRNEVPRVANPPVHTAATWTKVGTSGQTAFGTNSGNYYNGSMPMSGGVWKTADAGVSWTAVFDSQSTLNIGAFGVHPTSPNTVSVGTCGLYGGAYFIQGVFRSDDAEAT
jgi:hypothetical protein